MRQLSATLLLITACLCFARAQSPAGNPLQQAVKAHAAGKLDQAIPLYKNALKIQPKNFVANYNLGVILLIKHKTNEALPYLLAANTVEPKRPEPYMMRANAYLDLNKPAIALQVLYKGVNACGKSPEYC